MEGKILVVDDDAKIRKLCDNALKRQGYKVSVAGDAQEALKYFNEKPFDLALLDIVMPKVNGLELLKKLKKIDNNLLVIMITGYPQIETAVKAIKQGAYDYIAKPFSLDEIRLVIKRAFDYNHTLRENLQLKEELKKEYRSSELIGSSPKMIEIYRTIENVKGTDCTILIEGESGTGKEILARTIHKYSKRSDKPFLAINCGALPETLLESELFGFEKGAFTGAVNLKKGLFESANNGTVFLDEVGETSPAMQVKLLHTLDGKVSRRIGSTKNIKLDIRLIAATNKNLLNEVKNRNFREDLYYRLNIISMQMPALRERKQDIPILLKHFLYMCNIKYSKEITGFSKEAMELLMIYDYPGNVRELENITEGVIILSEDIIIQKDTLPEVIKKQSEIITENNFELEQAEKKHINRILEFTNYNKTKAANLLGIDRKTLYKKIKKYELLAK
ncbi:sigma-54-dependent transcriptional regulator [candidate division KSB1 bacterium]